MDFARSEIRSTIDEARDAIWNLRQPGETVGGLGEKIESMAAQIGSEFNARIDYTLKARRLQCGSQSHMIC